jgi:hypothetical protein
MNLHSNPWIKKVEIHGFFEVFTLSIAISNTKETLIVKFFRTYSIFIHKCQDVLIVLTVSYIQ